MLPHEELIQLAAVGKLDVECLFDVFADYNSKQTTDFTLEAFRKVILRKNKFKIYDKIV